MSFPAPFDLIRRTISIGSSKKIGRLSKLLIIRQAPLVLSEAEGTSDEGDNGAVPYVLCMEVRNETLK